VNREIVLLVETYPAPTEKFLYRDAVELARRGVPLSFYYLRRGTGDAEEEPEARRVPRAPSLRRLGAVAAFIWRHRRGFVPLVLGALFSARPARNTYHLLRAVLFTEMVESRAAGCILAGFASLPARYARTAARLSGIPYGIWAHARDVLVETPGLAENLREAAWIVFCTRAVREITCTRYPNLEEKSAYIHHGLPLPPGEKKVFHRDRLVVAAAGRFVPKKGFDVLVEACAAARKRGLPVECIMAGDGPLRKRCMERAAALGLEGTVRFPGFLSRDGIDALWKEADLLCVPSVPAPDGDMDGIPNVILEAGARGVPAAASDLPAIREAVEHGVNGFLVSPGSAERLAETLAAFHALPSAEKERMARAAREIVAERFAPAAAADTWLALLREKGVIR